MWPADKVFCRSAAWSPTLLCCGPSAQRSCESWPTCRPALQAQPPLLWKRLPSWMPSTKASVFGSKAKCGPVSAVVWYLQHGRLLNSWSSLMQGQAELGQAASAKQRATKARLSGSTPRTPRPPATPRPPQTPGRTYRGSTPARAPRRRILSGDHSRAAPGTQVPAEAAPWAEVHAEAAQLSSRAAPGAQGHAEAAQLSSPAAAEAEQPLAGSSPEPQPEQARASDLAREAQAEASQSADQPADQPDAAAEAGGDAGRPTPDSQHATEQLSQPHTEPDAAPPDPPPPQPAPAETHQREPQACAAAEQTLRPPALPMAAEGSSSGTVLPCTWDAEQPAATPLDEEPDLDPSRRGTQHRHSGGSPQAGTASEALRLKRRPMQTRPGSAQPSSSSPPVRLRRPSSAMPPPR